MNNNHLEENPFLFAKRWVNSSVAIGAAADIANKTELTCDDYMKYVFGEIYPVYQEDVRKLFEDCFFGTMQLHYQYTDIILALSKIEELITEKEHLNILSEAIIFFNNKYWNLDKKWIVETGMGNSNLGKTIKEKILKLEKNPEGHQLRKEDSHEMPRICHISDIHFGSQHMFLKFADIDHKFHRTDCFINFLRREKRKGRCIDVMVISGDITSVASEDEYKRFEVFLNEICEINVFKNGLFWENIVLVPGNHEIRRGEDTTRGDYLNSFKDFISDMKSRELYICTPYSLKGEGCCVINGTSKESVPFAVHHFQDINLQVLSLITCYYSQGLDKEVCILIETFEAIKNNFISKDALSQASIKKIENYFNRRIWLDSGFLTIDYIGAVPNKLQELDLTGSKNIAIGHHNATKYFIVPKQQDTENAQLLLQELEADYNFTAYLHGHIHAAPSPSDRQLQEISSATLGGFPSEGNSGFNILTWDIDKPNEQFIVERYELKQNKYVKL